MDTSPIIAKGAGNAGDTGHSICRASGAPKVRFSWFRGESAIPVRATEKYFIEFNKINLATYQSVLLIRNVGPSDYGAYKCVARNDIGFASHTIRLYVTSPPEMPSSLTVLNVTHDSVTVSWIPGFSGGLSPTYRLRYRPTGAITEGYKYVDVLQDNATTYTIAGLSVATDYTISIMAFNKLGGSKYYPDLLSAKTSSQGERRPDLPDDLLEKADVPRLVIIGLSVTGVLLMLQIVVLVSCFIYRKKSKVKREAASEQSSSKSATIQMYGPSSYN